ncbi:MAG: nucleotidyltransferase domain-containing protein [Bacteroidetes bacterium]|nr:nucleotidyltransferase domain-containing protein [Bacteroidota bacterium]
MTDDKIIKEISAEMKSKFSDFYGIYFFGSRARGEGNNESDIDIAVLFDRKIDWRFEGIIFDIITEYMLKYDIILDVKVYSKEDILKPITRFRYTVKKEGIFYGI